MVLVLLLLADDCVAYDHLVCYRILGYFAVTWCDAQIISPALVAENDITNIYTYNPVIVAIRLPYIQTYIKLYFISNFRVVKNRLISPRNEENPKMK